MPTVTLVIRILGQVPSRVPAAGDYLQVVTLSEIADIAVIARHRRHRVMHLGATKTYCSTSACSLVRKWLSFLTGSCCSDVGDDGDDGDPGDSCDAIAGGFFKNSHTPATAFRTI